AMIRTKGEAGTGDVVNAVTHMRAVFGGIRRLGSLRGEELYAEAKELRAPYELVRWVGENGRLPVVTFTAGGIATPAAAALFMQLGADRAFSRRRSLHAARRRRRLRRLRHLQVRRSGAPREGDRRGDDALPRRRDP